MSSVFIDEGAVRDGYENVRNDETPENWVVLKYDGKQIFVYESGINYEDFYAQFGDEEAVYGYVRVETGDEMSRRAKFAMITWVGSNISPLKKARVSTDKAFVKQVWIQFGKEIIADEKSELAYDKIADILERASGAAYGTGK
ncbi:coactosin-like protein [Lytechinus variegatus]|uniref:coactosin-like protein n=1 Tax=Lytechinus variegatus TaxID=7654 RepID=UPI001BB0EA73|nr:coactosin-like protein [Lytechinus variegatus]